MTRNRKQQRGVVLIAVVWSVFILTALAFGLATLVRGGAEELHARKEHMRAYYVARGAVYKALPLVKQTATGPGLFLDGQPRVAWEEDGMHINVDVIDEGGKLDLNAAPPKLLEKLFVNFGIEAMEARGLVAAIQDWRDADDDTRLGGAESMYYLSLPQPYRPANRDFRSVEELLLVRGVTPQLFYGGFSVARNGTVERHLGLVDCLTVDTHASQVNINFAPLPVLLAIPNMSPELAQMIVQARQRKPLTSVEDFTRNYPVLLSGETLSSLSAGSSGVYTLLASGTATDGIEARVRVVVRVSGLDKPENQYTHEPAVPGPPFLILRWEDNYVR